MKKNLVLLMCVCMAVGAILFSGCAGMQKNQEMATFAVETMGMGIGYDMRESFIWTDDVQRYYDSVMDGEINLLAAQTAESYLKERTHPIIANRMIRLSGMVGFDLAGNDSITGIDNVKIEYLQAALTGFKLGLELR